MIKTIAMFIILFVVEVNAEEEIQSYTPFVTKLSCSVDSHILSLKNKEAFDIHIEKGVIGADNNFEWEPFVIMKEEDYLAVKSSRKDWLIQKHQISPLSISSNAKDELIIKSGETKFFPLDFHKGYDLKTNEKYVVYLSYFGYKTFIEQKKARISIFSNKILLNDGKCELYPRDKEK